MSTVLAEPVAQETETRARVIAMPRLQVLQQKAETNPLLVVFVATVISLIISTAAIGSVAAWIYLLRHSGAFTP